MDVVGAGAAAQVGELAVVLGGTLEGEGLDDEVVVTGVAVQVERVDVVEDDEVVVADAAVDRHRLADAVREPALGGVDRGEDILLRDSSQRRRAARPVQLADLEEVVALVAVDGDRGSRVVDVELVVAVAAVDDDRLECVVVVDPLDGVARTRRQRRRAVDQRDEREPVVGSRRAEQEHVGEVRAGDLQRVVAAAGGGARVEDVDEGGRPPADQVDVVGVVAVLPVECDERVDAVRAERRGRADEIRDRAVSEGARELDRVGPEVADQEAAAHEDVAGADARQRLEVCLHDGRARVEGDRDRRLLRVHDGRRRRRRRAQRRDRGAVVEVRCQRGGGVEQLRAGGAEAAIDVVAHRVRHVAPVDGDRARRSDGRRHLARGQRLVAAARDGADAVVVRAGREAADRIRVERHAERGDVIREVEAERAVGDALQRNGLHRVCTAAAWRCRRDEHVGGQQRLALVCEVADEFDRVGAGDRIPGHADVRRVVGLVLADSRQGHEGFLDAAVRKPSR